LHALAVSLYFLERVHARPLAVALLRLDMLKNRPRFRHYWVISDRSADDPRVRATCAQ
jgi:hypothetical protein